MVTIIVAIAIALALACVVVLRQGAIADQDQLFQRRPPPLTMSVQIICGDCSGERYRPNRTSLDLSGRCAQCGGRSYVLASIVASYRAQARAERVREAHAGSPSARVIPFKAPSSRESRSKRIAV